VRRRYTSKSPDPERHRRPQRDRGSPEIQTPVQPVMVSISDDSSPDGGEEVRNHPSICSPKASAVALGPNQEPAAAPSVPAQGLAPWGGPDTFWEKAATRWKAHTEAYKESTSDDTRLHDVMAGKGSVDQGRGPAAVDRQRRQPCRVDDIVAMLGGCRIATMQRVSEARRVTTCVELLQECLLGGDQHRRTRLWDALSDVECLELDRLLPEDRCKREDGILALLDGKSAGSASW